MTDNQIFDILTMILFANMGVVIIWGIIYVIWELSDDD